MASRIVSPSFANTHIKRCSAGRNDGVAAASSDGGPTGGRGLPTVLEFLVINVSVCLVLLSNCYIIYIALYGFKFNR